MTRLKLRLPLEVPEAAAAARVARAVTAGDWVARDEARSGFTETSKSFD